MKKSMVSILLCLVLVLACGVIPAFAASEAAVQIIPDQSNAARGENVTFSVYLSNPNAKAIEGIRFSLKADSGLSFVEVSKVNTGFMMKDVFFENDKLSACFVIATGDGGEISDNGSMSGTPSGGATAESIPLFQVTYRVEKEASFGSALSVSVDKNSRLEFFDHNSDSVECDISAVGSITVVCKHSNTTALKTEASCTTEGYTGDTYCADCGEFLSKGETIAKKPHTEVVIPKSAPTCTTAGKTEGTKCSVCGEVLKTQEEIPATGHVNLTKKNAAEASCSAEGYTGDTYCVDCGELVSKGEAIAKKAHTEEIIPETAPTCTAAGKAEGSKCSVCGEVLKTQEVLPAKGHSFSASETFEATCTADGYNIEKCSVCNEERRVTTTVALGHHAITVEDVAATCTGEGCSAYEKCDRCETNLTDPATIPAKGHSPEVIPAVAATCTKTGLTEGSQCSVCHEILIKQDDTAMISHTAGEPVSENETAASYQEVVYCKVCGYEMNRQTISKELIGDVNADGKVDLKDVSALYRIIVQGVPVSETSKKILDINGDGKVTLKDVSKLYDLITETRT